MKVKKFVRRERVGVKDLESLFWSFFHNKMMMLLMMIEHPFISRNVLYVEKQKIFLHDIYHHFLPAGSERKYHHAFKWLHAFLDKFPDVGPKKTLKAIQMVGLIYEAFGFKLEERIEEIRLKREMISDQKHSREGGVS